MHSSSSSHRSTTHIAWHANQVSSAHEGYTNGLGLSDGGRRCSHAILARSHTHNRLSSSYSLPFTRQLSTVTSTDTSVVNGTFLEGTKELFFAKFFMLELIFKLFLELKIAKKVDFQIKTHSVFSLWLTFVKTIWTCSFCSSNFPVMIKLSAHRWCSG